MARKQSMQTNSTQNSAPLASKSKSKKEVLQDSMFVFDEYESCVATLTGTTLFRNTSSTKFLVTPSWTKETSKAAMKQWFDRMKSLDRLMQIAKEAQVHIKPVEQAGSPKEFAFALEKLLRQAYFDSPLSSTPRAKARSRLIELMVFLWSERLICFPSATHTLFNHANLTHDIWGFGQSGAVLNQIRSAMGASESGTSASKTDRNRFIFLSRWAFSITAPRSSGDFDPGVYSLRDQKSYRTYWTSVLSGILRVQREEFGSAATSTPGNFGHARKVDKPGRDDKDFLWATNGRPEMENWRQQAAAFLRTFDSGWRGAIGAINPWLDIVIDRPDISRDPIKFLHRSTHASLGKLDSETLAIADKQLAVVHDLFNHILLTHCSTEDDHGVAHALPEFANPMKRPIRRGANMIETHREPMPTRFVSLCLDILMADDHKWSKSIGSADTFRWKNPETGFYEEMWSPIRTWFLILKLLLPSRTFQMRMLDSGEADSECYRPEKGGWIPNLGPLHLASAKNQPVRKGAFRKYRRKDGSEGSLLYFNTNKTADLNAEPDKRGYVMPWEHQDAIHWLLKVRDWQEKFNPTTVLTPWADLTEMKNSRPEDQLRRLGASSFLFRDAADQITPHHPLREGRIRSLWVRLLEELERRLAQSGDVLPDGSPHKIITSRNKDGSPISAIFDLHTLRVTMVSALYEQGVPPEVIMKIVGHASVMMTLYYTKISPHAVTDTLNDALMKLQQQEQTNWIGYLQGKSREQLTQLAAHSHESALDALAKASGSGIVVMDHGFCPMGAKRCDDGLIIQAASLGQAVSYAPVPGGASNCSRCRFFVTGPAFAVGLEAHVNDLSYRLKSKSKAYQDAQKGFDGICFERSQAAEKSMPFPRNRDLQVAESSFERATAEVDQIALSLQSAYALLEQSLSFLSNDKADHSKDAFALTVAGGGRIEAVIEEVHEVEQLQKICASAIFFQGLQIDTKQANLERMRFFDQMLARSGFSPAFCMMVDEDRAKKIADAMGKFLFSRLGRRDVGLLMDGKATLQSLGLDEAMKRQLADAQHAGDLSLNQTFPLFVLENTNGN